jgi:hypothetical protein
MSSFVNALVEWRFMIFAFSINDAQIQSCDVTTRARFQRVGTTHWLAIFTHRCAVCGLALWNARIKTAL